MYPKTIKLEDKKLKKILEERAELILQGRQKSMEIDALQGELDTIDQELVKAEKAVDISEFKPEAEELTKQFNEIQAKMNDINEKVRAHIKANTPQELRDKFDETRKKKEELEKERNKFALKASQKNDKMIPLARKLMQPYLEDEYDDYDTLRLENGEIIATIFNWIDDYKKNFDQRKAKRENRNLKPVATA